MELVNRDNTALTAVTSHIGLLSEFSLYATKNTNITDHLIPFIM
jgi:hypothetical protein